MSLTNFPNGITSFGCPVLPAAIPEVVTGSVFFVDSNTGSDNNDGKTKDVPLATLDRALALCTANKGDIIYLMPGHAETITGAGGITLDKAGVTIIGLGRYDARPAFLMDGGTAVTALVTAANMTLKNCIFRAGHADIVVGMVITAKGFRLEGCLFEQNIAAENWIDIIHAGAADNDYDGLEIINNEFHVYDEGLVTAIDLLKNGNDVKIIGNRIIGDFDATPFAPIYCAVAEIQLNILVAGNFIHNKHDGDAVVGISIANTASTGWIIGNHCGHQDAADDTAFLAGAAGLYCGENYSSGGTGTASGRLLPAVDT